MSTPERARIETLEGEPRAVQFQFNPNALSFDRDIDWSPSPNTSPGEEQFEYRGAGNPGVNLSALFNTYGDPTDEERDVRDETAILYKMTDPMETDESRAGRPPRVRFSWGPIQFTAYINKLSTKFSLFAPSGTPLRAHVDISLTIVDEFERLTGQNPTSRGLQRVSLYQVQIGDSLHRLATRFYGDCHRWRLIAEANGLTRVRGLTPGLTLRLPDV